VRHLSIVLLLLSVGLDLACSDSKPAVAAASSPASVPVSAAPASAPTPSADAAFIASGPLLVENQVDVSAQREGVVAAILVEPGTHVHSGDLMARLDDRQMEADFEASKARTRSTSADLHNWEAEAKVLDADLQRAQKLWDAGLITKEQFDHTRYKAESDHWDVERVKEMLNTTEASERSLALELEKTRIRAPFDGVVARRYVRVGQKVALGDRLLWVSAEWPLRVRFTLPENFIGHITAGQQFELTSPDLPELKPMARVIEISPVVDPASGTIEVLCQLVDAPRGLRPGMRANIRIPNPR